MKTILLVTFYLLFPAVLAYFVIVSRFASKLGVVFFAYIIGLIIGNIGILPANASEIQNILTTVTVPIAIPLLLFSLNVRSWLTTIKSTLLSLILGVISVIIPIVVGYFLFKNAIPEAYKISGLLAGVYTGGTPNLASIKLALDVNNETYLITHTYDMILSAIFLVFVMSIAQKILLTFLPAYPKKYSEEDQVKETNTSETKVIKSFYLNYLNKNALTSLLLALGLAVVIFAIGGLLTLIVPESAQMAVIILTITSLGIAASFHPKINKITQAYDLGMYLIIVFSLVVASMADFSKLNFTHVHLFVYITICVFGSFIIHAFLAKIFNIDADNVIVVATALACSPPFVPGVAAAIKNKEIIFSGMAVGIIGYAIGNYLGIGMALFLKIF